MTTPAHRVRASILQRVSFVVRGVMVRLEDQPSIVRMRALAAHRALTTLLDDLESSLGKKGRHNDERIRLLAGALAMLLDHHASDEERKLVPVLETVDAWGPARVQHLRADHRQEHEEARRLREDVCRRASFSKSELEEMIYAVREHIRSEERHSVSADVLRDDGIVIVEQFSG